MASTAPAYQAFAITPADATLLTKKPRQLYVGTGGDLSVILAHDDQANLGLADVVQFKNVPAGTFLDICVKRVMSTGTTASNILGLI